MIFKLIIKSLQEEKVMLCLKDLVLIDTQQEIYLPEFELTEEVFNYDMNGESVEEYIDENFDEAYVFNIFEAYLQRNYMVELDSRIKLETELVKGIHYDFEVEMGEE